MGIKLIVMFSGRAVGRHEFDDFKRIRIGRHEDCDIQIDNLGISRIHCEIVSRSGFTQLRDLQSGNGTFVNGRQIQTHNLNDGDLISLGKYSIRFENLDRTTAPGNLADVPVSDGLGMMTLQVDAAKLARKQRERMQQTKGYLSSPGRKDVVLDGALTLVGKDPDAQVHVDGWFCPRMIAVIVRDESGFRITDVSPGGRSLTINRVVKKSAPLGEDDVVTIRGVEFTFHNGLPVGAHA